MEDTQNEIDVSRIPMSEKDYYAEFFGDSETENEHLIRMALIGGYLDTE